MSHPGSSSLHNETHHSNPLSRLGNRDFKDVSALQFSEQRSPVHPFSTGTIFHGTGQLSSHSGKRLEHAAVHETTGLPVSCERPRAPTFNMGLFRLVAPSNATLLSRAVNPELISTAYSSLKRSVITPITQSSF